MAPQRENVMVHIRGTIVYVSMQASETLTKRCAEIRRKNEHSLVQRKLWGKAGPDSASRHNTMLWINAYHELFRKNDFSPLGECAVPKDIWIALAGMTDELMNEIDNTCLVNGPYKTREKTTQDERTKAVRDKHSQEISEVLAEKIIKYLNLTRKIDAKDYIYTIMPTEDKIVLVSTLFVGAMRSAVAPRINAAYRSGNGYFQELVKGHDFAYWHDPYSYQNGSKFSGRIIDTFYENVYNLFRYKLLNNVASADGVELLLHAVSHALGKWAIESGICCDIQPDEEGAKRYMHVPATMPYKLYWYPCPPDVIPNNNNDSSNVCRPIRQPSDTARERLKLSCSDDIEFISARKASETAVNKGTGKKQFIPDDYDSVLVIDDGDSRDEARTPFVTRMQHLPVQPRTRMPSSLHAPSASSPSTASMPNANLLVNNNYRAPTSEHYQQILPPMPAPLPRRLRPAATGPFSAAPRFQNSFASPVVPPVSYTGNNVQRNFVPASNHASDIIMTSMLSIPSRSCRNNNDNNNRHKRPNPSSGGSPPLPSLPSQAKRIADSRKRDQPTELAKARQLATEKYADRRKEAAAGMLTKTVSKTSALPDISAIPIPSNLPSPGDANNSESCSSSSSTTAVIGGYGRTMNPFESPSSSTPTPLRLPSNSNGRTALLPLSVPAQTASISPPAKVGWKLTPPTSTVSRAENNPSSSRQASGESTFDLDILLDVPAVDPLPSSAPPTMPKAMAQPKRSAERIIQHYDIADVVPTVPTIDETRSAKRRTVSGQTASSSSGGLSDVRRPNLLAVDKGSGSKKDSGCSSISSVNDRSSKQLGSKKPKLTTASISDVGRDSPTKTSSNKQGTAAAVTAAESNVADVIPSFSSSASSAESGNKSIRRGGDSVLGINFDGAEKNHVEPQEIRRSSHDNGAKSGANSLDKFHIPKHKSSTRASDRNNFFDEVDDVFDNGAGVDAVSDQPVAVNFSSTASAVDLVVDAVEFVAETVHETGIAAAECRLTVRNDGDGLSQPDVVIAGVGTTVGKKDAATRSDSAITVQLINTEQSVGDSESTTADLRVNNANVAVGLSCGVGNAVVSPAAPEDADFELLFKKRCGKIHEAAAAQMREKAAARKLQQRRERQKDAAKAAEQVASVSSLSTSVVAPVAGAVLTSNGMFFKRESLTADTAGVDDVSADAVNSSVYDFQASQRVDARSSRRRRSKSKKKLKRSEKNETESLGVLRFASDKDLQSELPVLPEAEKLISALLGNEEAVEDQQPGHVSVNITGERSRTATTTSNSDDDALVQSMLLHLETAPIETPLQPARNGSLLSDRQTTSPEQRKYEQQNMKLIEHLVSGFDEKARQKERWQQQMKSIGVVFDSKMKRPEDIRGELQVLKAEMMEGVDDITDFAMHMLASPFAGQNGDGASDSNGQT